MSHLQYTAKSHRFQGNVRQISQTYHYFYRNYQTKEGTCGAFCRTI